jgi:hypothetical protein
MQAYGGQGYSTSSTSSSWCTFQCICVHFSLSQSVGRPGGEGGGNMSYMEVHGQLTTTIDWPPHTQRQTRRYIKLILRRDKVRFRHYSHGCTVELEQWSGSAHNNGIYWHAYEHELVSEAGRNMSHLYTPASIAGTYWSLLSMHHTQSYTFVYC